MNWQNEKVILLVIQYNGQWINNLQNGIGSHIWQDERGEGKYLKNRYEGEWKDGKRHGKFIINNYNYHY